MKHLKCLLVALLLLCNIAVRAHDFMVGGICYNITSESLMMVEVTYMGEYPYENDIYSGEIVIPEKVTYDGKVYDVTGIGQNAFAGSSALVGVRIPKSVTSLGEWAFEDCAEALESIVVDADNKVYDSRNNCNALIETSTNTLLAGCKNSIIPEGVVAIAEYAFYGCSDLQEINLPASVESIGNGAFMGCAGGLEKISVDAGNKVYDSRDNCNALIETASNSLLIGCKNSEIPYGVANIKDAAFAFCTGLKSVQIPSSVKSFGHEAFAGSGLVSVEIPESVVFYGFWAFYGCESLTSIKLPAGVENWGVELFAGCTSLAEVVIPEGSTTIGESMFADCTSLKSVKIPNGVKTIESSAFEGCSSLADIVIPNSVTTIGGKALYETAWYNNQPEGVLYMNRFLLGYKGEMPENTYVVVKDGTTAICEYAFDMQYGLSGIEVPKTVTSVGGYAFDGTKWYDELPDGVVYINNVLYEYKGEMPENTHIVVKDGTVAVSCNAFSRRSELSGIELPSSLRSIGEMAFEGCSSLVSVVIPDGVTSVGDQAFGMCSSLKNIDIPNSIKTLGRFLFYECSSLSNVRLPDGLTVVREGMFADCASLVDIVIPDAVTSIRYDAFSYCSALANVTIGKGVEYIGDGVFQDCMSLSNVTSYIPADELFAVDAYVFMSLDLSDCTLYVPAGTKNVYSATSGWRDFGNIVELEGAGIDNVIAGAVRGVYYDLNGRAVENPAKGVYIVNGKKVLVR